MWDDKTLEDAQASTRRVEVNGEHLIIRPKKFKMDGDIALDEDRVLSGYMTLDKLAKAAGLKVFDLALPQPWVQKEYWDKGQPTPWAVWCYDQNKIFGSPVFAAEMLQKIAKMV